jgi:hypothetical protein
VIAERGDWSANMGRIEALFERLVAAAGARGSGARERESPGAAPGPPPASGGR